LYWPTQPFATVFDVTWVPLAPLSFFCLLAPPIEGLSPVLVRQIGDILRDVADLPLVDRVNAAEG
jgi:hypothetical protein